MEIKNFFAQDAQGNIMPSADCYLYYPGTTTLVDGLVNVDGLPIANPFKASLIGQVEFGAPNGIYDLRIIRGARDTMIRIQCADLLQAINETAAFLGAHATPPTTRNDGSPLQIADRYLNTTDGIEYIYKDTGWSSNDISDISEFGRELIAQPDAETVKEKLILENVDNTADLQKPISDPQKQFMIEGNGSALGYNAGFLNSVTRTMQSRGRDEPSVFDYFTSAADIADVVNGTRLYDHTAQCQAFIDAMKGFSDPQFRNGKFPGGDYNITQLVFTDHNDVGFKMESARFNWVGTTATNGALKFINAINVAVRGNWVVNGYDSLLLENGVWLTTGPGDGITVPTVGVSSLVLLDGLTGYRCKNAIKFGTYNADPSIAEIVLSNMRTQMCPGGVHIAGSQTGVQIVGSTIVSAPGNFAPGSAEESAIRMEGGFATVSGSIVEHVASGLGQLIHMSPCQSSLYGNSYPTLQFGGATHIESAAYIALIDNPRGIPSPDSKHMCLDMSSVQGYIGAVPAAQNLIIHNVDNSFSGVTKVSGGNLYAGNTVRSASNIAYTAQCPNARVEVGPTSFGNGCKPWLGGVLNGKVVHGPVAAVSASNLNGLSIAGSSSALASFSTNKTTGNFERYGPDYAGGVYTVHSGGASLIRIKFQALFIAPGNGYIEVVRNGVRASINAISTASNPYSITIDYEESDVIAGTSFQIRITNTGSGAMTFGSSSSDSLVITMATN